MHPNILAFVTFARCLINSEDFASKGATELEVLIQGIFNKRRFLEKVLHLIVLGLTHG
jgi:hypothetical protein